MPVFAPEDLPLFFEDFGEVATFKRRGSSAGQTVRASFDEGKALGMGGDSGEDADEIMRPGLGEYTVIYLGQDQISARPAYQDKVVRAGGDVFTIMQAKAEDGLWKVWAVSDARASF